MTPISLNSNETASLNRIEITIQVKCKNFITENNSFEQTFNRYRDYESSQNISDIESLLIKEITDELVEDIFNKAFVNW